MVYKPRKTVNGHKRNDRAARRRKARDARKRRLAARPVRSNIKRYVAEQFGKTHPDNRYYLSFPTLKPSNKLDDTPRYYPFGATFQKAFLNMEFKRMKEVVSQTPALAPLIGAVSTGDITDANKKIGNHNHWRSVLGRGIHMKHATVYGTISLHEQIPLRAQSILKYGNLKLHMFVLEDKAVTKSEFLSWYQSFLTANHDNDLKKSEAPRSISATDGPVTNGSYDEDLLFVPYVAGSKYPPIAQNVNVSTRSVCGEGDLGAIERPNSGFDEFLIDWRKFYQTTGDSGANPEDSLFYNEVKCTTSWDGTRDKSVLPVNKSRFIVHEHKTWSFKPKANGCVDTVIPFEYSFPDHYMHYDKELLDMPFVFSNSASPDSADDRGILPDWMFPRKQPFIVFVYTCDNPMMVDTPDRYHHVQYDNTNNTAQVNHPNHPPGAVNILAGGHPDHPSTTQVDADVPVSTGHPMDVEQQDGDLHVRKVEPGSRSANSYYTERYIHAEQVTIRSDEVFHIDMNFKCTYENKLATSIVPTINKGRPIIHKRESAPRTRTKRPLRDAGPAKDLETMLRAQKRAKAVDSGKDMRAAMRRKEASLLPSSISKKSTHARDYKNLQIAKTKPNGIYVRNGIMFIFGTREGEAKKSWPHIASGEFRKIPRYKAAHKLITIDKFEGNNKIRAVVGHSKGAAVAHQLIMDFPHLKGRGYAYPHARMHSDTRFQTFRHFGDPASMLDFQAKTSDKPYRGPLSAHESSGYTGKYAKYKQDL